MSDIQIRIQTTPNPNAKKFVASQDFKTDGKTSFTSLEDCIHIPLARHLFLLTNVTQIHFYENIATITQNGMSEWEFLEGKAAELIKRMLPEHDASFQTADEKRRDALPEDMRKIEEVLDRYIRPSLRMDGGDVEVLEVDDKIVTIRYQGACGSCPSSQLGTLEAIRGVLQDEFNPEVDVITVD